MRQFIRCKSRCGALLFAGLLCLLLSSRRSSGAITHNSPWANSFFKSLPFRKLALAIEQHRPASQCSDLQCVLRKLDSRCLCGYHWRLGLALLSDGVNIMQAINLSLYPYPTRSVPDIALFPHVHGRHVPLLEKRYVIYKGIKTYCQDYAGI